MTVDNIAGYCFESTLWRILCDITSNREFNITPTHYPLIRSNNLLICNESFEIASQTQLCSESDAIWHIGALISYLSSGHPIFGGKGKEFHDKHPSIQLPSLRKEHSALTPIVHSCLNANESQRISFAELKKQALIGYNDCIKREKIRIELPQKQSTTSISHNEMWPEAMIPQTSNNI